MLERGYIIGHCRGECLDSDNLYSEAKSSAAYGAPKKRRKGEGIDEKGEIMKKFLWE